jgi:exonuclease SbcC
MKLKRIVLDNIRSYCHEEINFNEGSTLLAGDIGSGKTSILLGIEFALFGLQPGQRGSSLLRNGMEEGGVEIDFLVDNHSVNIKRTLKRGKTVSQDYCSIKVDDKFEELSVTELKNRVLDLLNYPKEFSRKQNILYKFTVYTPQEGMKQIILEDPKTRVDTLRHVFGIDKYKRILENASFLTTKIREEKRLKQGLTANLDIEKESLQNKSAELEIKIKDLKVYELEVLKKANDKREAEKELEELSKKREEKLRLSQEIEKTKLMISNKEETVFSNRKLIQELSIQIEEIEKLGFDENKIGSIEEEIKRKREERFVLQEKRLEVNSKLTSLQMKNQENEDMKNRLKHIDICPTCLQDVDSVYKSNVSNKIDRETTDNIDEIKNLTIKNKEVGDKISNLDYDLINLEKEAQELRLLKVKVEGSLEKKKRKEDLACSNESLKKDTELLKSHIEILNKDVFEMGKYDNLYNSKKEEFDFCTKEERKAEIILAELKKEIEVFKTQIEEAGEKIRKTEEIKEELNYLEELEAWITKRFVPVVSNIEKNVMVKLKAEFSRLFADWFKMLVTDSFNARLTDDFTPIIEQMDYEIDYQYLSGGERTAVALAYRLALNQVINSMLSKIKTRDLVILDEPTDGFSEQQLDKIRDVLNELNVGQLIVVSHEQKIEGFVENVIKFKKENGESKMDSNLSEDLFS